KPWRAALGHAKLSHGRGIFLYSASQCWESGVTGASIVFVVDDDPSVRSSLKFLLSTVGLQVESFVSADAFLHSKPSDAPSCLVLDVRLPGLTGPDLQLELMRRRKVIPIIFITADRDPALRQRLIEQ